MKSLLKRLVRILIGMIAGLLLAAIGNIDKNDLNILTWAKMSFNLC